MCWKYWKYEKWGEAEKERHSEQKCISRQYVWQIVENDQQRAC